MRKMLHKDQKGFTLIELLVVIAIIGILAAVAIPQFAEYRANAYCSRVESDVSNTMIAEEAYFVENDKYTTLLADLGIQTDPNVAITVPSITPTLTVEGVDSTANCTKGAKFVAAAGAPGAWQ